MASFCVTLGKKELEKFVAKIKNSNFAARKAWKIRLDGQY